MQRIRLIRLLLSVVFAAACLAAPARAEQITMAFCGGYPPFYEHGGVEGQGTFEHGLFIDFLKAFEAAHPEFSIHKIRIPRKRIDEWLREDKVQAFCLNSPIFVRPKELKLYEFSAPLCRSCDHVAVPADSGFVYNGPESLEGHTLGIVHGNGYGQLDPLIASGDIPTATPYGEQPLLRMLRRGHIEMAVLNEFTGRTAMDRLNIPQDQIRFLEPPIYCFDLCIQVRKERHDFVRALDGFIAASEANGFLPDLRRRWLARP